LENPAITASRVKEVFLGVVLKQVPDRIGVEVVEIVNSTALALKSLLVLMV